MNILIENDGALWTCVVCRHGGRDTVQLLTRLERTYPDNYWHFLCPAHWAQLRRLLMRALLESEI